MKRILLFIALLGLVAKSEISKATTHYTGIVKVRYIRSSDNDCSYGIDTTSAGMVEYDVSQRGGQSDSISYNIFGTYPLFPMPGLQFNGNSTQVSYLKNDADSIIFTFVFHRSHTERNQVPIGDPCREYNVYEDYTGIAKISTTTAGVHHLGSNELIAFFPNPTTTVLRIKSEINKVVVTDYLGKIIMKQTLDEADGNGFTKLDVSSLPTGSYLIWLDANERKVFGKFVKH